MAPVRNGAYFERTSWRWAFPISALLLWFTWTVFWPGQNLYNTFGPLGFVSKYLVEHHYPLMYYGWWLALAIHIGEALYSLKVCREKGVDSVLTRFLWFLQTFLFGMASLHFLLEYEPAPHPKQT
ncbi:transmembrane protein 254-like [Megalops cyprinoides]|uniref:transmembrane protein 254-like n=1 Tax=Megalops cyprinoides TaxID=118141 RepID=UPI00186433FD|nr:transmembrane protein 254-like [Megalops cyprinoides]